MALTLVSFPPLASNNYNSWSIQMKTFLRGQELWDVIEVGFDVMLAAAVSMKAQREARVRDKKALSFLHQGVDEANFDKIIEVRNAKTAWELLQKAYQSADERRKEEEEKRRFDSAKAERAAVEKAQAEARERAERAVILRVQEDEDEENDEDEDESDEDDEDEDADQESCVGDEPLASEGDDNKVREDNEQHSDELACLKDEKEADLAKFIQALEKIANLEKQIDVG
ncbi:hypothetical protein Droror1_Dr00021330 [Drosera rotundifolia]